VGTVCAAVDHELNHARGARECIFGFFECADDAEVASVLLDEAAAWGRDRGLDLLVGPFNLDYEDSYGLLVDGRERPPVILCGHTPAYYQRLVEGIGFTPLREDNVAYALDLDLNTRAFRNLARLADKARAHRSYRIRSADFSIWRDEIDPLLDLLRQALGHLQDSRPWDRRTLESILSGLIRFADPELILFAHAGDRLVGWLPGVPNLNEAFIHVDGLRRPWSYLSLARHLARRPACLALKSVVVLPEYWGSGVAALLFDEMAHRAARKGYRWVDLSLTSVGNPQTPALAIRMGGTIYKRYRVYRRPIAPG
jgi:GNAT superfamily N-acetyltransferase